MNNHLAPIFQLVLSRLEKNHLDYWVYGGVTIAAYAGRFVRDNQDVDIFVKDNDFNTLIQITNILCIQYNFKHKLTYKGTAKRPRVEILIDGIERFSAVPIYEQAERVIFKYDDGDQEYSSSILEKVERNISGYRFFTSQDSYIKEMFINHIKARPDKVTREKIIIDAMVILSPEERASLGF